MKKRRSIVAVLAIVTLAVLAWFEPTYVVRGWLRGEAFYEGRPTTYWHARLVRWLDHFFEPGDAQRVLDFWHWDGLIDGDGFTLSARPATTWERFQAWLGKDWTDSLTPPELLCGDPAAEPVLRELLDDPSELVRSHARVGLERLDRTSMKFNKLP